MILPYILTLHHSSLVSKMLKIGQKMLKIGQKNNIPIHSI